MPAGTASSANLRHSVRRYKYIVCGEPPVHKTYKVDDKHFVPSVAMTAAEYRKCASPDTAALITRFLTQFWNAKSTSTLRPARVMPPSCFTSWRLGSLCFALAMVSVASKSMERFSGLDMWRSSVSAASDARRALPGEATRLAVVAVRARVVADGRVGLWGRLPGGCNGWGCAAGAATDGGATMRDCRTGAGCNRCGSAQRGACKAKIFLL